MNDDKKYYITLGKNGESRIEEKRSVFIGYARSVRSEDEANAFIKEIKAKHSDATHNVYGYAMRSGILCRYSDDGEPSGTAGKPVLEVIKKSGADDTAVVVTRYFGGTLLGTGGLVHAYSLAAKAAIENAGIVRYEKYAECRLSCGYSDYQKISFEFSRYGVIVDDTDFSDSVSISFAVKEEDHVALIKKINELSAGGVKTIKTGSRYDFPGN